MTLAIALAALMLGITSVAGMIADRIMVRHRFSRTLEELANAYVKDAVTPSDKKNATGVKVEIAPSSAATPAWSDLREYIRDTPLQVDAGSFFPPDTDVFTRYGYSGPRLRYPVIGGMGTVNVEPPFVPAPTPPDIDFSHYKPMISNCTPEIDHRYYMYSDDPVREAVDFIEHLKKGTEADRLMAQKLEGIVPPGGDDEFDVTSDKFIIDPRVERGSDND